MIIVALASVKGGVGKTASTIYLASEFARRLGPGKVAVVDRDRTSRNLTKTWHWLAPPKGVDLAPDERIPEGYEIVLIDTPPGLDAVPSLNGAELVIVPTKLEPQSVVSLDEYFNEVQVQRSTTSPQLRLVAILPTLVRAGEDTAEIQQVVEGIAGQHGLTLLPRVRDMRPIARWSWGSKEYRAPAREVLRHAGYDS
jgi:cellulose biosynthesis protein BcsQ